MADTLKEMLDSVSEDYDKSEGGIFYDVLAPVAKENDKIIEYADGILDRRLLDTATGEDLDRAARECGVDRKLAQFAEGNVTFYGTAGTFISAGALVASEGTIFCTKADCTIAEDGTAAVEIICTKSGAVGNVGAGYITRLPVTLAGVDSVYNDYPTEGGYDEETDEELRERTYFAIRAPRGGGNKNDYIYWAMSVEGVGGVRVTPLWLGAGTVKVVIVDSNGEAAGDELVTAVYDYIETVRPVGADVTVSPATAVTIDISVTLAITSGYNADLVGESVTEAIDAYLKTFRLSGASVSYAKIGAAILDVEGVDDYSDLLINGGTSNVILGEDEVPAIGATSYGT